MNTEIIVKIQLKIIYDKLMILNNEVLNLLSIAFFFNKKNIEKILEIYNKNNKNYNNHKEQVKNIQDFIKKYFEYLENDKNKITTDKIISDINNKIFTIYNLNRTQYFQINKLLDILKDKKNKIIKDKINVELNNIIIELSYLYLRIFYFYSYIENLYKNLSEYIAIYSYTEWLIQFSFYNNELKSILDSLNIIAKSLKFRKENAYQSYVPIPLFHRRYRIYNSQLILNKYIKEILSNFIKKNEFLFDKNKIENIEFIITSDYDIGDYIENTPYSDITLIKGSFFWRELYKFQPIIVHEISHKLIKLLNNKLKKNLNEIINEILITYKTIFKRKTFDRSFFENFRDDILCDFLAYLIFGDSYLLSLIFNGLLGQKYFETLSTYNFDENNNKKFIFYFFNPGINFNNFREKAIIRIFLLIRLRKEIFNFIYDKKNKKDLKCLLVSIDEKNYEQAQKNLFYYINKFILDLFPVEKFDFQKAGQDDFFYTFSHLFYHNKTTSLLISKLIKKIVNLFKHYFDDNIIKNFRPIEYRYRNNYFQNNLNIIDYKNLEKPLIINYNINNHDKINKIYLQFNNNIKNYNNNCNIFNLLWKIFIKKVIENKYDIHKNIPDGRIFRALLTLNLNKFFYELKNVLQKDLIELELDDLIFLKTRFIYENEIEKSDDKKKGNDEEKSDDNEKIIKLKNNYCNLTKILKSSKDKKLSIYISTGPYESVFLYSDLYNYNSTKTNEYEFYKKIIECYGYVDRHSILKFYINSKNKTNNDAENKDQFWRAFILIKLNENYLHENNSSKNENKFKNLIKIINDYQNCIEFIALSLGWEDLVICVKGSLSEIFKIKKAINSEESSIIKRTETIITFNCFCNHSNNQTEKNDNTIKFNIILSCRMEKINTIFHNDEKKLNQYDFTEYLTPGRYDKTLVFNQLFNEEEIKNIIKTILDSKLKNVKDLSINIIMKDIKKDN